MILTSRRGRIEPPNLDDRSWADLVEQMRALIPTYAPAWTDHNPSDLGMTLIELFAWLGESVLYRLNQTPMKNYIAFLNLLGIVRAPATPAETYLTFTAAADRVVLPAGTQAQTQAAADQAAIVFETDEPVVLLPTTLAAAVVVGPYASAADATTYVNATDLLVGPPTGRTSLTVPAGQTLQVCLGFLSSVTAELSLGLRLDSPLVGSGAVRWVYAKGSTEPMAWPDVTQIRDGTAGLTHNGMVRLTLPADWTARRATAPAGIPADQAWSKVTAADPGQVVTDSLFWLGVRITSPASTAVSVRIDRLLFNAALARTASTIRSPEVLGNSTGGPYQVFPLANRPLFRGSSVEPSYDHLIVQVGTGTPPVWQTWTQVDHLAAGNEQAYVLNPVTSEIMFGNYDDQHRGGHGLIPPAGSVIQALSYRYVTAGAPGNVVPGRVVALGSTLTGGQPTGVTKVINAGPGLGGVDEEPIEQTLSRAPEELKVRNRAVTAEDYEFLARQVRAVAISRCLEPRFHKTANAPLWKIDDPWTYASIDRARGNVNVIVVPDQGLDVGRPEPTQEQLDEVRGYLDQRRDLTAKLAVTGPRYLPIAVTVVITIWPAASVAGVDLPGLQTTTLQLIRGFLHPTRGGPDGQGWQVGQTVFTSDIFRAIQPPPDIGFISDLSITAKIPSYHFPPLKPDGNAGNWKPADERPFDLAEKANSVRVADYELVCAAPDKEHAISTPTLTD